MFDHDQYLKDHPDRYEEWVGVLRSKSGVIDLDDDHIIDRHSQHNHKADHGALFRCQKDSEILRLVYEAMEKAPYTFTKSDAVIVHYDAGLNIGVALDRVTMLTAIQVVIDTKGMDTESDWENALVSTAYPIAAGNFGKRAVGED
jgi:hypothetical protein